MATLSIRIDDDTKNRWNSLAKAHGLNQSEIFLVRERLARPFTAVSDDDVWKELGIED